jgi:hypothetical protein
LTRLLYVEFCQTDMDWKVAVPPDAPPRINAKCNVSSTLNVLPPPFIFSSLDKIRRGRKSEGKRRGEGAKGGRGGWREGST